MPSVNAWCIINNSTDQTCLDVIEACAAKQSFGNEFTFEVTEYGTWKFRVFDCYDGGDEVEFSVDKNGGVSVRRVLAGGIREERTVSF